MVIPHLVDKTFASAAKEDGVVESIDDTLKLITIKYKDGSRDVISFETKQGSVSGLYLDQPLELNVKLGEKVKRGDILVYNPGFFVPNNDSKQVSWKHGVFATTVLIECDDTIEDSCALSKEFSDKMSMRPTHMRPVKMTKDTTIHEIAKEGDHVKNTDRICIIEDESIAELGIASNEESYEYLLDTNKKLPKARNSGYISKIEVFYSCPIEEMSPSVAKVVKSLIKKKNQQHKYAKEHGLENQFPKSQQVKKGTKIKGMEFDDDTIGFFFYITEDVACLTGDKVVFDSSLKSVLSGLLPNGIVTEKGRAVDAFFAASSPNNRKVTSPFRQGYIQGIMETAEQRIIEIMET